MLTKLPPHTGQAGIVLQLLCFAVLVWDGEPCGSMEPDSV
ncbi:hypothetical protein K239x_09750 [Planctomycetes bacterium K23_9]|uniref:Uncharacterized protein n=1 Tax=Stieleria marina TaxID=1930275 RepID=A0A517NPI0_9BACT|nr:hypothetical protein K239x_09750 [Planctomycetes bacterium K23_9]